MSATISDRLSIAVFMIKWVDEYFWNTEIVITFKQLYFRANNNAKIYTSNWSRLFSYFISCLWRSKSRVGISVLLCNDQFLVRFNYRNVFTTQIYCEWSVTKRKKKILIHLLTLSCSLFLNSNLNGKSFINGRVWMLENLPI